VLSNAQHYLLWSSLKPPIQKSRFSPFSTTFFELSSSIFLPLLGSYRRRDEMKPSISVIAAARRFLGIPPRNSHVSSGKRSDSTPILDGSSFLLGHFSLFLSLSSLCKGMLTRCSAPTFMEMHLLIYPGSACSRLCLTSVLREVYYLGERPPRPLLPFTVRSILSHSTDFAATCLYRFDRFLRPLPLSILRGSTFNASHSKIVQIRFPDLVRVGPRRGGLIMIQ